MDIDTLIDFGDFFDEEAGGDVVADAFASGEGAPEIIQQEQEMRPLPEYKPEEYISPTTEGQQAAIEPPSQSIMERFGAAASEGQEKIKDFWEKLSDKEKNSMFRYAMATVGTGAQAALQSIQQRRGQEFQREMQERQYQERERERRDAEEARRVSGTPSAYQFNVTQRGIINQGMGG